MVGGTEQVYSEKMACSECGISVPQLEPRSFSFNSPYGACPACNGLGSKYDFDPSKVIVDWTRPLFEGGLGPGAGSVFLKRSLELGAMAHGFDLSTPFEKFPRDVQNLILYGNPPSNAKSNGNGASWQLRTPLRKTVPGLHFQGVIGFLERSFEESEFGHVPRVDHAIHVARAVRGLRRAAVAPGKPGRESGRPLDRRIHRAGHFRRAPRRGSNSRRPDAAADATLPGARSPKSPRASIFCSPSASAISAWTAPPPRFPAAKRSAFAWRRRSARVCAACSTCWTSLPSACTRATTTA